jgi:hypothetical protein
VRKSLGVENTLYVLSAILSLAFVSLVILSLVITSLWAGERVEVAESTAFRLWRLEHQHLQPEPNQPAVGLKKASDHDEVLRRVRERLVRKIRNELAALTNYDVFDNLLFSLDERNVVTLSGQVRLPSLKAGAERFVRCLEGITEVVNQIEVLPASEFDGAIRHDAFLRIYPPSQDNRYASGAVPSIPIIVRRGNLAFSESATENQCMNRQFKPARRPITDGSSRSESLRLLEQN